MTGNNLVAQMMVLSEDNGGRVPANRLAARAVLLGLASALVLSGCTRTTDLNQGGVLPTTQNPPASLEPAPLTPVNEQTLAPAQPVEQAGVPTAEPIPGVEEPVQVASAEPPANAQPVTRQAMIGAWTVSTGGANCQIFLALTKWSGGYRAASRGCSAAAIADVQAWDVKDTQVVLVDSSGGTAATLYKSSDQRYDGSTKGGGAISFSR